MNTTYNTVETTTVAAGVGSLVTQLADRPFKDDAGGATQILVHQEGSSSFEDSLKTIQFLRKPVCCLPGPQQPAVTSPSGTDYGAGLKGPCSPDFQWPKWARLCNACTGKCDHGGNCYAARDPCSCGAIFFRHLRFYLPPDLAAVAKEAGVTVRFRQTRWKKSHYEPELLVEPIRHMDNDEFMVMPLLYSFINDLCEHLKATPALLRFNHGDWGSGGTHAHLHLFFTPATISGALKTRYTMAKQAYEADPDDEDKLQLVSGLAALHLDGEYGNHHDYVAQNEREYRQLLAARGDDAGQSAESGSESNCKRWSGGPYKRGTASKGRKKQLKGRRPASFTVAVSFGNWLPSAVDDMVCFFKHCGIAYEGGKPKARLEGKKVLVTFTTEAGVEKALTADGENLPRMWWLSVTRCGGLLGASPREGSYVLPHRRNKHNPATSAADTTE